MMGWVKFLAACAALTALAGPAAAQITEWKSDYGPMTLEFAGAEVYGYYPAYDGELFGEYDPQYDLLSLYWVQTSSEVKCGQALYGSLYWGRVDFYGLANGGPLQGQWSYCDRPPGSSGQWNATFLAGDQPDITLQEAYAHEPLPVFPEDTTQLIRDYYGQLFPWDEAQTLVFDMTCDGVEDTVMGWPEGSNPDAIGDYNIMVVYDHGYGLEQASLSLASDGSQYGLCTGPDGWPDPLLEVEYIGKLEPDAFGLSPGCGAKLRIDDGYCDYIRLYWVGDQTPETPFLIDRN